MKDLRIRYLLLVFLAFISSGLLLTIIQPPFNAAFLAWCAYVPFILACSPKVKVKNLILVSYVVSLAYWLGNLYWIFPVTFAGWLAFCAYTAVLWPGLGCCLRYCRIKKVPLFLAVPVLIVAIERLQGCFLGGFYWRHLSHSQYADISIIQIADIFGASGVSLLVAMVNGLLAELVISIRIKRFSENRCLLKMAIVAAAVTATILYGRWRIDQSNKFIEAGPAVAALQSNIPQSVKETFEASEQIFDELLVSSSAAAEAGAELIVWPETMAQAILDRDVWPYLVASELEIKFDAALREHSKDTGYVLVGAYSARLQKQGHSEIGLARYNSAFLYLPDGHQDIRRYDKIHLVPFGEFVPFRKTFPWIYNLLMKFTPYDYDYSLEAGQNYTVFEMASAAGGKLQNYKFGVMICYEDTVPEIARAFALNQQGRKQVDWLVNISNDGWFVRFADNKVYASTELQQHATVCVFRAVENRLAVLRSVNTGISCMIDSLGRIRDGFLAGDMPHNAMDRKSCAGWFVDNVPCDTRVTFFSRYGQWLDACCLLGLAALMAKPVVERLISRRRKNISKDNANESSLN